MNNPMTSPADLVAGIEYEADERKRDPGRCYIKAGFRRVGFTKGGLVALQMPPEDMPEASPPLGLQMEIAA